MSIAFSSVIPPMCSDQPLVLYELNEVPWRVVDWYVSMRPHSTLAHILKSSLTFSSFTSDEGELHPWSTWPTFHRGVTNKEHNIRFINQNHEMADLLYPPIWQTLKSEGIKVGVFGSLQSYMSDIDPGYEFFVPDTFSPSDVAWPLKYSAFQRFNLRQVQNDSAKVQNLNLSCGVFGDVFRMLGSGLRLKTCLSLVHHLINEKLNSLHCKRRPVMQALVSFDFFEDALRNSSPQFCTFFTNHVAGMMHRYWMYAFPDDFSYKLTSKRDYFYSKNILYAMDVADWQLSRLLSYVTKRNGRLMIASSMGQEAIHRDPYCGEWRIADVGLFLRAIKWSKPVENRLAMQPDFNFTFDSEVDAAQFVELTSRLTDSNGFSIWKRVRQVENTVNLALSPSKTALHDSTVCINHRIGLSSRFSIFELGIDLLNRDPGTGYHQPIGLVMLTGEGIRPLDSRYQIESTHVRPLIMRMFGLEDESSSNLS